jgi:anaerobic magnesium-protoporphyrin IX monomethyl ester cyclase
MPPQGFPPSPHAAFYREFPVAPMVASRGCPYPCVYCAGKLTMGKTVRYRSVDNVLEEVRLLLGRYKVREIHLVDDNFTYSKEYVLEFCRKVGEESLKFFWTCPNGVRLNTLDEEILSAMKKAGCYAVAVGVESGSQRVLDNMRKGLTLEEIRSKIGAIRRVGLTPIGFFVLGFPGETRAEMEQTLGFSTSLGLRRANFMLFHPFPGTEVFKWIQKRHQRNGLLLTAPSFAEVSYIPEGFSARELKDLQRKAFLRFYLRPGVLLRFIGDIRSIRHAYYISRRTLRWMRRGS